jgi:hypothetical protein
MCFVGLCKSFGDIKNLRNVWNTPHIYLETLMKFMLHISIE